MRLGGLLLVASSGLMLSACATGGGARFAPSTKALPASAPVSIPVLPTPTTQPEARRALELGFAAQRGGDAELAAAQFRSVLATDFLTDAGRMNVYWQCARAHRELGDVEGEQDALEGFLLAAQLVPLSDDDVARLVEAETILTGQRRGSARLSRGPGVSLRAATASNGASGRAVPHR